MRWTLLQPCRAISIHAAREGGDRFVTASRHGVLLFQSTPPVKAATRTFPRERYTRGYFNPRRP